MQQQEQEPGCCVVAVKLDGILTVMGNYYGPDKIPPGHCLKVTCNYLDLYII